MIPEAVKDFKGTVIDSTRMRTTTPAASRASSQSRAVTPATAPKTRPVATPTIPHAQSSPGAVDGSFLSAAQCDRFLALRSVLRDATLSSQLRRLRETNPRPGAKTDYLNLCNIVDLWLISAIVAGKRTRLVGGHENVGCDCEAGVGGRGSIGSGGYRVIGRCGKRGRGGLDHGGAGRWR